MADANYKFLYVDVGAEGGADDAETWNNCTLSQAMESSRDCLPADRFLPNDNTAIPFHFVADDDEEMVSPNSWGKDLQLYLNHIMEPGSWRTETNLLQ